jgi:hypothetical protein
VANSLLGSFAAGNYSRSIMKRQSFELEQLEGRALFSVISLIDGVTITDSPSATDFVPTLDMEPTFATTTVGSTSGAAATVPTPFPNALNIAGKFSHPLGNPDTGSRYNFRGSGKTKTLGDFTLKGYVQPPGLIANGHASGIFILTGAHGTIRLSVTGPAQSGALPSSLSFRIVRGSGAYLNSSGKGTIALAASSTTHKFLFRVKPTT